MLAIRDSVTIPCYPLDVVGGEDEGPPLVPPGESLRSLQFSTNYTGQKLEFCDKKVRSWLEKGWDRGNEHKRRRGRGA